MDVSVVSHWEQTQPDQNGVGSAVGYIQAAKQFGSGSDTLITYITHGMIKLVIFTYVKGVRRGH